MEDLPEKNIAKSAPEPTAFVRSDPMPASIGRIVHYVPESDKDVTASNYAKVVPAIIVSCHGVQVVNLQVFIDGEKGVAWKTSVKYDENKQSGTWHWPQRV